MRYVTDYQTMGQTRTGDAILDDALNGGFPAESAILLTGGPGTGKTTVAMQFLQAGVENGENCLFLSTEQSSRDIRKSLSPYSFEFDHPNLTIATIHAGTGKSVASGEEGLVLRTLDGDTAIDEGRSLSFTAESISKFIGEFGRQDRVVLDSASGLAALSDDQAMYRRMVLELIRMFKTDFEATALFTAQEYTAQDDVGENLSTLASSASLEFTADGVLRVWQENIRGEFHRFIHITKMRGVDHETQPFQMTLVGERLRVRPSRRSPALELSARARHVTGLDGLDDLLGGGFVEGGSVVYKHDGESHSDIILIKSVLEMVQQGERVIFIPPSGLAYDQLNLLAEKLTGRSIDWYLEEQGLEIIDLLSQGRDARAFVPEDKLFESVVTLDNSDGVQDEISSIHFQADHRTTTYIAVDTLLQRLDSSYLRRLHSTINAKIRSEPHTLIYQLNPDLIDPFLDEFLTESSDQVLYQLRRQDGMEYVCLEKSVGGHVGSNRLVEYHEGPPYVEIAF